MVMQGPALSSLTDIQLIRLIHRGDLKARDVLVHRYLDLVGKIANKILPRLPMTVGYDELVSDGGLGLLSAIDLYDPSRGSSFGAYAAVRIRGEIIDGLRERLWESRLEHGRHDKIVKFISSYRNSNGMNPTPAEIAKGVGIPIGKLHITLAKISNFSDLWEEQDNSITATDYYGPAVSDQSLRAVDDNDEVQFLIDGLSKREQAVVAMRYFGDLALADIGEMIGRSEGIACITIKDATTKMRKECEALSGV